MDEKEISKLRKIQKENPECIILLQLADFHLQNNRVKEAKRICSKLLKVHSENPSVNHLMGKCLQAENQLKKAKDHFERVVKADPGYIEALRNLASLYRKEENKIEEIKYHKKILEVDPLDPDARKQYQQLLKEVEKEAPEKIPDTAKPEKEPEAGVSVKEKEEEVKPKKPAAIKKKKKEIKPEKPEEEKALEEELSALDFSNFERELAQLEKTHREGKEEPIELIEEKAEPEPPIEPTPEVQIEEKPPEKKPPEPPPIKEEEIEEPEPITEPPPEPEIEEKPPEEKPPEPTGVIEEEEKKEEDEFEKELQAIAEGKIIPEIEEPPAPEEEISEEEVPEETIKKEVSEEPGEKEVPEKEVSEKPPEKEVPADTGKKESVPPYKTNPKLATFTLADVYISQKQFKEAIEVLKILKEKGEDLKRITEKLDEIKRLQRESNSG